MALGEEMTIVFFTKRNEMCPAVGLPTSIHRGVPRHLACVSIFEDTEMSFSSKDYEKTFNFHMQRFEMNISFTQAFPSLTRTIECNRYQLGFAAILARSVLKLAKNHQAMQANYFFQGRGLFCFINLCFYSLKQARITLLSQVRIFMRCPI